MDQVGLPRRPIRSIGTVTSPGVPLPLDGDTGAQACPNTTS
jgi:hypothetical protein